MSLDRGHTLFLLSSRTPRAPSAIALATYCCTRWLLLSAVRCLLSRAGLRVAAELKLNSTTGPLFTACGAPHVSDSVCLTGCSRGRRHHSITAWQARLGATRCVDNILCHTRKVNRHLLRSASRSRLRSEKLICAAKRLGTAVVLCVCGV